MRKKRTALILAASLFVFLGGCNNNKTADTLSAEDAKKAISDYSPGAIITECDYNEDKSVYEIKFETDYGEYNATVDSKSGKVLSVTLIEPDPVVPDDPVDGDGSKQILTPDDALTVAIMDADVSGSVMTVKNDYDRDENAYFLIFRSGNKEFTYKIDAETGDILDSSVDMDS